MGKKAMNLILFGSGGHAGVVIDAVVCGAAWTIEGLIDGTRSLGEVPHGYLVISLPENRDAFTYHIAIGDGEVRERISNELNLRWTNIFHPLSYRASKLDCQGSFFGAYSVVGNDSEVGDFCILNTGAILDHDSTLGDFSHLCPGVVTGGHVHIGSRTTVGVGSMIRDGVTIGDNCIIGMGSVVIKDVPNNTTVWGNPAKVQYENGSRRT